ncbi:hypothetical protein PENNAL_c0359G04739, partial [Penicillium nalgiovense]
SIRCIAGAFRTTAGPAL